MEEQGLDEPPEQDEQQDKDEPPELGKQQFLECDPSGRFWRYSTVLGKGSTKTVYKAIDTFNSKEMAWCKAKLNDDARFTSALNQEVDILKSLSHDNIVQLYASWIKTSDDSLNLITELCSSSLRNYRLQQKHVEINDVKKCAKQLLSAMAYMHSQRIIHRDIKCDNVLVKQSSDGGTSFKIGDFGLASRLPAWGRMYQIVGTPEFMAAEIFDEDYNQLVDVYSFGMCMIELITGEYPYSECRNPGHIFKNVVSSVKPKALFKINDTEALRFINRCLLPESVRPSAAELLSDPFLQVDETKSQLRASKGEFGSTTNSSVMENRQNSSESHHTFRVSCKLVNSSTLEFDVRIKRSGRSRYIVFKFDLQNDSPWGVAEEMVQTLGYSESDVLIIADLISKEVSKLSVCSDQGCYVHRRHTNTVQKSLRCVWHGLD